MMRLDPISQRASTHTLDEKAAVRRLGNARTTEHPAHCLNSCVLNRRRRSSKPAKLYQKILANHLHTRHSHHALPDSALPGLEAL
jgi:hypothetical protein